MNNLILKIQLLIVNSFNTIPAFFNKEKGATMVEYAIMVALIAVVSILVIQGLGQQVSQTFGIVSGSMAQVTG
ncbi:MAG: Flp family type IVb pilin [Gammaproteobacteria bacterium]